MFTPSTLMNSPPAITFVVYGVRAWTGELGPAPAVSALHAAPSHLAMLRAATPPAVVNDPPAYSAPLYTASASVTGSASLVRPLPSALHVTPSHRAMPRTESPPPVRNDPPAVRAPVNTVRALTSPPRPVPRGCHRPPSHAPMFAGRET